jgi:CheY-like chemotaxis protein
MRQRKILIVHESKMIRNIIRNHLMAELEDVVTDFASSASEVFAKIQQTVFDVVICGNEMKEADGISICQAMHQGGINKDTPFMIITASPSPENLRKFAQSGIDSVISNRERSSSLLTS